MLGWNTDQHVHMVNHQVPLFYSAFSPLAQTIKPRRNDLVTKMDRRIIIEDKQDFHKALLNPEDSYTLDTSFIERLNLTI